MSSKRLTSASTRAATRTGSFVIPSIIVVIVVAAIATIEAGCSGTTRNLTRSSAQKMIVESERFKTPMVAALKDNHDFRTFPHSPDETEQAVQERVLHIYLASYTAVAVMRHLGYVDVKVSVREPYRATRPTEFSAPSPWVFNIEPTLTLKGQELARSQGLTGDKAVPLAGREMIEITGIREKEGQAAVDFTWKVIPTEAGQVFDPTSDAFKNLPAELQQALTKLNGSGPFDIASAESWKSVLKSTAVFQKYDDGWRLMSISELY